MINTNAVAVAFPDITSYFGISLVTAGWVLNSYLLVFTVAAVLVGKIGDMYGRKRTFLTCAVLFVVGSGLSSIAQSVEFLIFFRLIQGIGGGGLVPTAVGIMADIFPRSRQKAVGISISISNMGGIIGPTIGALLVTSLGWRSIFWINVPLGALACIPIIFLLKSNPGVKSRIDLAGAGLFAVVLSLVLIGITQIKVENSPIQWLVVAVLILGGIGVGYLFVRHETRTAEPFIEMELLRSKPFAAANLYNLIFGACTHGLTSFIPLFAVTVYGMTTVESGLVLSVRSVGAIAATVLISIFMVRWGYRKPILIGSILTATGIIFMGLEPGPWEVLGGASSNLVILCLLGLTMGIGFGISSPGFVNACIDLMPEKGATVTGMGSMFRQYGAAINIAVTTLLVQSAGDMAFGFKVAFMAMGILALCSIPLVWVIPSKTASGGRG
jgi:EmrB/QacA subfamily drug resistance transporter